MTDVFASFFLLQSILQNLLTSCRIRGSSVWCPIFQELMFISKLSLLSNSYCRGKFTMSVWKCLSIMGPTWFWQFLKCRNFKACNTSMGLSLLHRISLQVTLSYTKWDEPCHFPYLDTNKYIIHAQLNGAVYIPAHICITNKIELLCDTGEYLVYLGWKP